MEAYRAKYGYIGIFIGTFLEGETTVLLGGIFSNLGYMSIWIVMLYDLPAYCKRKGERSLWR